MKKKKEKEKEKKVYGYATSLVKMLVLNKKQPFPGAHIKTQKCLYLKTVCL